ncbi:50S ribosomal protein L24e [Candidatus Woesearchaeota archaeon]|nr:50S ribosomal protein L24e [Candidatus Woesearchaeota archaeon]
MVTCSFCGNDYERGVGKTFVLKSGKILHFCSGKCEKNMLVLKRKARNLKWTKNFVKGE